MHDPRDLDEPGCYGPGERHKRKATWSEKNPEGRWRAFAYDEVADDLRSALGEIEDILGELERRASDPTR